MSGYLIHLSCPACTTTCDLDDRRPRVCRCRACGRTWQLVYELREYRNPTHLAPDELRRRRAEWTRRGWAKATPEERRARTEAARNASRSRRESASSPARTEQAS